MCKASLPTGIDKGEAMIILVVNIFFPGIGTMIASNMGEGGCKCDTCMIGLLQLLTAFLIVGWVWSICWSLELRKAAIAAEQKGAPPAPEYVQPPPPAQQTA